MHLRCTSPKTAGFLSDGKTITFSQKNYCKEYSTFKLPCSKCIECRLEYARSWAIRASHEAQIHPQNSFITLTYSDEHLESPRLIYEHWQEFIAKIRREQSEPIGYLVAGEYGDITKRPHWHAIIFNYRPSDFQYFRKTDLGHNVYISERLTHLWGRGHAEFGSVTFESAGYVCRYSAKKLVHGKDNEHSYQPIFKASSKQAIGKAWLERHWRDIFMHGSVVLPDGTSIGTIPRYYEKWLIKNKPDQWRKYVTKTKAEKLKSIIQRQEKDLQNEARVNHLRSLRGQLSHCPTKNQVRNKIANKRIEALKTIRKTTC